MSAYTVIITAGGIGKRMGTEIPKQFLLLNGKAILQHCIEAFHEFDPTIQLLVTLPETWMPFWKDLCQKNNFIIPHQLVDGGKERYHSIQEALKFATGSLIAVHDGVRPLVTQDIIINTFESAKKNQAAIPVIHVYDSLRKLRDGNSSAVLRKEYVLVQTPQVFGSELLKKAYEQTFHEGITDDASLVEELGAKIHLVEGDECNIKITSPFDLKVAELYLKKH
jgi:2-C-methyl-D-erythritol 4-phosphate cytidylyltransferase